MTKPNQTKPNQTKPNQCKAKQSKPKPNQSKQNQGKPSPSSKPHQASHEPRGVSQGGAKRVSHLPGVTLKGVTSLTGCCTTECHTTYRVLKGVTSLTGCYTTECHTTCSVLHLQGPQYLDVGRMIMRRITGGHCGSCYSQGTRAPGHTP